MPSERLMLLHNIDPLYKKSGIPLYPDLFDTRVRAALRYGSYKLITGDPGEGKWIPPPSAKNQPQTSDGDSNLYFQQGLTPVTLCFVKVSP